MPLRTTALSTSRWLFNQSYLTLLNGILDNFCLGGRMHLTIHLALQENSIKRLRPHEEQRSKHPQVVVFKPPGLHYYYHLKWHNVGSNVSRFGVSGIQIKACRVMKPHNGNLELRRCVLYSARCLVGIPLPDNLLLHTSPRLFALRKDKCETVKVLHD